MFNFKRLILILILASSSVYADSFSTKHFSAAVGFQANSLLYKRGIITYEGYQVFPIYSVQLFYPNLLLAGSALYYKIPLSSDSFFLRTRLNFDATNDEPLYITEEEEEDRIRRDTTNEFDLFLEKHFEDNSFIRFQFSKDLVAHHGSYYEVYGRLSLFNLVGASNKGSLLDLGVFASVGYGDEKHNEYLYGIGADKDSLNNLEYGITLTSPRAIDSFWPTLKISSFQILEDNKHGSFVQETSGVSAEVLAAIKVW